MGLATYSNSALSVKDTQGKLWLHRVNRACLWLEQRFIFFFLKTAVCYTGLLRDA